jgi:hypothetical protein
MELFGETLANTKRRNSFASLTQAETNIVRIQTDPSYKGGCQCRVVDTPVVRCCNQNMAQVTESKQDKPPLLYERRLSCRPLLYSNDSANNSLKGTIIILSKSK